MSYIGKNIKKIRTVRKLSQAAFAEKFNLARPSVGAYEEGRAEPKIDTIIQIANYFGLSIDLLLIKELSVKDLFKFEIAGDELSRNNVMLSELMAKEQNSGVSYVGEEIYLEYIVNREKRDFIEKLRKILIPYNANDVSRAFQLNGSEMEFNHNGLHHGDILSTVQVASDYLQHIKVGRIYVIVTAQFISTRRFAAVTGNQWEFRSDDPNYPELEITTDQILELWEVKGVYSTYLNPPSLVESRILQIENEIRHLKAKIG